MARYLMIEGGRVVNAVEWDGSLATWRPPDGTEMLRSDPSEKDLIGQIGDTWDGATFTKPVSPPPAPEDDPVVAKIAESMAVLVDNGVIKKNDLPDDVKAAIDKKNA